MQPAPVKNNPILCSPATLWHNSSSTSLLASSSLVMDSNIDPDDVVVAELDVVFSNELAGLQSQLIMLQQPLRPNWRAYDAGAPGKLWSAS